MEEPGREVVGVRVARILEVSPHPDADRLQLADVEDGDGTTRVVCGAPEHRTPACSCPSHPPARRLPGGLTLERRKIRGQASDGMLCSPRELGLGDDHEGILILDTDAELGHRRARRCSASTTSCSTSRSRRTVPTRCASSGVAREIAAHFGQPFAIPAAEPQARRDRSRPTSASSSRILDRCPRYLARVARVTLGASPAWMQQRLVKAGMRPISNVVDVTNYVLLERNQPLHAFDLDRLAGRGIVVRLARDRRAHDHARRRGARARRRGPADLRCRTCTAGHRRDHGRLRRRRCRRTRPRMLLESAYFERMGIARSSKRLRLRSESSARFERGIDPDGVAVHAARAMDLLEQVAAAAVAPDAVDEYPEPARPPADPAAHEPKVNRILGTTVTDDTVLAALRPLEIEVDGSGDELTATPPSFRPDLEREIDLVEEVARRIGFESIGRTVPKAAEQVGGLTPAPARAPASSPTRSSARAPSEVMALPLVSPALLADFGLSGAVALTNPLRADESVLRMALSRASLRTAAASTRPAATPTSRCSSSAPCSSRPSRARVLPVEREHVAALLAGSVRRAPVEPDRPVDAYDAVDLARVVLDGLGVAGLRFEPDGVPGSIRRRRACSWSTPSRSAPWGQVRSCGRRRTGSRRRGGRVRGRPGRPRRSRRVAIGSSCRRHRSRRRRSTSRSSSTTVRRGRRRRRCARRRRHARVDPRVRRVPQRAAGCRRGAASRSRAVPRARPDPHRRGARGAPATLHRRRRPHHGAELR